MSNETELQLTPTIRSRPIRVSAVAGEPFILNHELGRIPAGWLVIDTDEFVMLRRSGAMDSNRLELTADQDSELTLVLL